MDDTRFACSLDDKDLAARGADWRSLDAVLIESRETAGGYTARYEGDEATARALEALVVAERECCPEFDWRLEREDSGVIRLDVAYEADRNAEISSANRLG